MDLNLLQRDKVVVSTLSKIDVYFSQIKLYYWNMLFPSGIISGSIIQLPLGFFLYFELHSLVLCLVQFLNDHVQIFKNFWLASIIQPFRHQTFSWSLYISRSSPFSIVVFMSLPTTLISKLYHVDLRSINAMHNAASGSDEYFSARCCGIRERSKNSALETASSSAKICSELTQLGCKLTYA